eukprot:c27089_g1_i1 orf=208-2325(+)
MRNRIRNKGHKANGKQSSNTLADTAMEELDDDIDAFYKRREKIPLDVNDDSDVSSDAVEEPVFNLRTDSSGESDSRGSDEDDLDVGQLTGIAAKMAKQAKIVRQRTSLMENEDDEDDDDKERENAVWGKQKRLYYSADNVDYELQSSDEESPAEEEAEVLRLQRIKAESLRLEDFGLDEEDQLERKEEEVTKPTEEKDSQAKAGIQKWHAGKSFGDDKIISVEEARRDWDALSKEEQMEVVMSDAPELVGLLTELREELDELKFKIEPLLTKAKERRYVSKFGVQYLEAKHIQLLCYCQYIVFYLLLKAEGHSIHDHPVIACLVEIRMLQEKIRPIDKKLQHEIEKLLKLVNLPLNSTEEADSGFEYKDDLKDKPNLDIHISKLDEDALENGGASHPPLRIPTVVDKKIQMKDTEVTVQAKKTDLHVTDRSTFVPEVANELQDIPNKIKEFVTAESKEMLRERERLRLHAEQGVAFTCIPASNAEREETKTLKQLRNWRMGMLDGLDDDIANLVGIVKEKPIKRPLADLVKPQKLWQLVANAGKETKKQKILSGDADVPLREDLGERRAKLEVHKLSKWQAHAEEEYEQNDAHLEEDEFYEEAKKLKAAKKAIQSTKCSLSASIPAEGNAGERRHISYEMEKNKGLTPYRKKASRNPRKKYKVKHHKAIIRRKGQIREVKHLTGSYGGEATGIRTGISRSIRFQS